MLLSSTPPPPEARSARQHKPVGNLRWMVCGLLLLATVLNYVDRISLSVLAPRLQNQFHWSNIQFGEVLATFQLSYALFNPVWGAIVDRWGIRRGYTLAVVGWSLAAMGHALSRGVADFRIWRGLLGASEAGSFPGGIKTLAEWFPQQERGTANGWFNAGANIGSMAAPLIVTLTAVRFGWRGAFVVTGGLGFLWATIWWLFYRPPGTHPRLSAKERAWITQDGPHRETLPRVPWRQLIGERRAWAFILGKTFSDPVFGFFVFWLPKFLSEVLHMDENGRMWATCAVFLIADAGSVGGGWLSGFLIQRGWSVNRARKTTLAVAAFSVPWVVFAGFTRNHALALGLIGMALAMHQWWSSNLFTLTSDMFPTEAVGTVVGMGQVGGSLSGMVVQLLIGLALDRFGGSYGPLFIASMFFYPSAFLLVHLFAPKLDRVTLKYA